MVADHDAYIAEAPQELRPLLIRLRAQLARALPDADFSLSKPIPDKLIKKLALASRRTQVP